MNLVQVQNNQVVVSSRQVAEHFEKRHDKLLAEINRMYHEYIVDGVSPKMVETPMFLKTSYIHPQNRQKYPEYLMTRDGFSLLAMSFTGKKALEWKLKYIQAFNEMEKRLKQLPKLTSTEIIAQIAQNAVEHERRIKALENLGGNIVSEVKEIKNTFTKKDTLEEDIKNLVNRMVKCSYSNDYKDAYARLYSELQKLTGARINVRWNNKTEEERRKSSKLKMIMSDKKLRAGMIAAYESVARDVHMFELEEAVQ